ncbi:MAG: hypothetical protein IKX67_00620 [Bacteroidales bacterium]|nr:hypothetical protein [Bacteroidales bacterium]
MKKILFVFAALCAAVLYSCTPKELEIETPVQQGEETVVNLIPLTITASLEGTKADMVETTWTWKSGDKLAVYDGTAKREFTLDETSADTGVAKFTGEVAEGFTSLQAVFPFEAAGDTFDTPIIPAVQTIPDGATIDPNAMIATAARAEKNGDDYTFYFTSGVSLLRFAVQGGVSKVILHIATKDETIAGESPSVEVNLAGTEGTRYWVAVNPAKYSGLYVFSKASDDNYYLRQTDAEIDLSAPGKAKNLGTLAVTADNQVDVIETGDQLVSYLAEPYNRGFIVKDLDLTGKTVTTCDSFEMTFNGLWHSINNWTSAGVPLFNKNYGIIENFTIDKSCSLNLPETLSGPVAFVVVNNYQTVSGIVNNADITGTVDFGGGRAAAIVGLCDAKDLGHGITVKDCVNNGNITLNTVANTGGTQYVGTVLGSMGNSTENVIENCTNNGNLTITCTGTNTKNFYIGGVAGGTTNGSQNIGLKNNGDVTLTCAGHSAALCLAGISSYTTGCVTDCENTGKITFHSDAALKATFVSGIAGYFASNTMSGCVNRGDVSVEAGYIAGRNNIGDLTAESGKELSFVSGNAIAAGLSIGGLVSATGRNPVFTDSNNYGNISLSLTDPANASVGTNTAARPSAGGLVGDCSGPMTDCNNYGDVTVNIGNGTEFTAPNAGYTLYVGGLVGSSWNFSGATTKTGNDYNARNKFTLTNCNNSGSISVHSDNTHSTNHAYGGLVGWPQSEDDTAVYVAKNCNNSGNVTASGSVKARVGGIHGGTGRIDGCTNTGTITIISGQSGSVAGSVAGFHSRSHSLSNCNAYGKVEAKVPVTGLGGLVGNLGNYAFTGMLGCAVDCVLVGGPEGGTGLVVGLFNGTTKAITLGSEADPIEVAGFVDGTAITSSNAAGYLCGSTNYTEGTHTIFANCENATAPTYRLYVMDEKVATGGSWGSTRTIWYSSEAGDIACAGTEASGDYTYNYFDLTSDVVGQTIDIYYKGVGEPDKPCEVKITLTVQSSVKNYYYRTDGVQVAAVTNPSSPEALDATPRIYVRSSSDNLNCHMWGGAEGTAWPGNAFTTLSSKEYGDFWHYVDLLPDATMFILNDGSRQTGDLSLADYTASDGSYYFYWYPGADAPTPVTW